MAELAEEGDDDDDDHSPSAGSAASLELYHSVRGLIPDGHVRDKDQISMKSDCATGLRRRLSIVNAQDHKVGGLLAGLAAFRCEISPLNISPARLEDAGHTPAVVFHLFVCFYLPTCLLTYILSGCEWSSG